MMKKHYLSKKEREEIGAKLQNCRLYRHLRSLALRTEGQAEYFSLSAEDLLYHTSFTLDRLLELMAESEEEAIGYCRDLWQELRVHFAEHVECDDKDHQLAATLIVGTTANLLFICNKARYWTTRDALVASAKEGNSALRETVEQIISDVLYKEEVAKDLKNWMMEYVSNGDCLSDFINQIIEGVQNQTTLLGIEDQEEIVEQLKIYFGDDKEKAEAFLFSIHGQDDMTIIMKIAELVNCKPIKMLKKNKTKLHQILQSHQLYHSSKVNFSNLLKERGW